MRTIEKARQRGGGNYSSYSDTLEGLAVGEQVMMTRSCTLLDRRDRRAPRRRPGRLLRPDRVRRAARCREVGAEAPYRAGSCGRGEVGPGAAGADNGGFAGYDCLD